MKLIKSIISLSLIYLLILPIQAQVRFYLSPDQVLAPQNDTIIIVVNLDATASILSVGSFTGSLKWDSSIFTLISNPQVSDPFTGFVNQNNASSGEVKFNGIHPLGTSDMIRIMELIFLVSANTDTFSTIVDLDIQVLASARNFTDLTSNLSVEDTNLDIITSLNPHLKQKIFQLITFPNPFLNEISIRYFMPSSDQVSLELYNSVGQRVSVLVDEFQYAGDHQFTWNQKNVITKLPSGIYSLRFKALDAIISELVVLGKN